MRFSGGCAVGVHGAAVGASFACRWDNQWIAAVQLGRPGDDGLPVVRAYMYHATAVLSPVHDTAMLLGS
jgi:hypothetical protein